MSKISITSLEFSFGSVSIIFNRKVIEFLFVLFHILFTNVDFSSLLRLKETTRPFSNECLGTTRPVIPIDSSDFALDIRMPGVTPKEVRGILCFTIHLSVCRL